MDHARCSELLPALERGELDAPTGDAVRGHLDGCPDCSLELAGLRAMHASPVEPLSAAERTRLRAGIAQATAEPATQETVTPTRRHGLWTRVAPALGGISIVAIVIAGLVMGGGSDLGTSGGDADGGGGGGGRATEGATDSAGGAESAAEPAVIRDGDALWAGDIGKVTERQLSRSVRRRRLLVGGATPYRSADSSSKFTAVNAAEETLGNLAALELLAGDPTGQQITECATSVTESLPYPSVPTYAAIAELEGDPVLLMGFRWTEAGQRDLDEFMLWAWPIGDCAVPLFYGAGTPQD